MAQPCRLIEVSGSPHERGLQYGRQAAAEIGRSIGHYAAQVKALSLTAARLTDIVRAYVPRIESFDATYVEEMRGIAAGASVDFELVVLVNARTEIVQLARNPQLFDVLQNAMEADGCTTVVVRPDAARDGQLIHAHNWDWKLECAESSVILKIRNQDGPDILTFTEAGALGRFGFNALGICITGNGLECDRDYRQIGVPLALLRRKVLAQTYLAPALTTVYTTQKSGSNNIAVSHAASGLVYNFECAPDETFMVPDTGGVLVHANHWLSPVALGKIRERGIGSAPSTLYREQRAREALAKKAGRLTVEDVTAVLLDDFQSPWSICYPPRAANLTDSSLYATVASLIMRPILGEMRVAMLPARDKRFTAYTLEMESVVGSPGGVSTPALAHG
ncbi:MAG: acyl-CoA--6-aminopenicillanic acid acyltransferase [Rhodospirillaceae bacterium]|nr:acyl-CoA--6-aminopenicillanic acid acyltransferase [Rhodospirillaceae bacterium]